MRFLELYESNETDNNKELISIEKILGDLEHFHDSKKARAEFLNKIHRPGQQPDKAFTYGGDGTGKGAGGKSISYTADVGSNQPSDDFARIISKIKDGHQNWKKEIEEVINLVKNSNQQQYIKAYFIPKVENPGARLTITGNLRSDNRVADEDDYEKFGKAMVFYAGKCVSKLTDADTKIGPDKFKIIMQGCFGAAPGNNGEEDSFLMQFKDLESKLKIDAAKNVIKSIHTAGTKDIEGINFEDESYYSGISYLVTNRLFESDENNENNSFIACPKTIDEFNKNVGIALRQSKAIAEKYPKQYKLWYEKLRAAFDRGVEEYQRIERDSDTKEIINPITGEKEHRHGKAWGAGGPNAFIRDNPDLKAITDKIRQGTPGCEGVNGWDIFNCGPKLILTIFDALEHGGKIYQRLCDDLSTGMRQIKRSLGTTKPEDFDKLIKKYASENEHARAMEVSISGVLCSLANLYKILANGKIGQLNLETKTFNSENSNNETIIQHRIDELKSTIAYATKEKVDYEKWKEIENKKHEEYIKKLESEIAALSKQSEGKQQKESMTTISVKNILTEEEKETKNQKMVSDVQKELKKKKEELEKAKKNDKTVLKLSNYIAILDDYKNVLSLQPYIKDAYNTITILFNPDAAQEQYQELFNNDTNNEDDSNEEDNSQQKTNEKVSLNSRLDKILAEYKLFEEEGETIDLDEVDDGDSNNKPTEKKNEESKSEQQDNNHKNEVEVKSKNKGNLNWVKQDQAQGLKAIYRIFGEGKDNVRFDLDTFKELANIKSIKDAFKKVCIVLENLQKTLGSLKPVEPIIDGIVACNKIENIKNIPGCIETIKPEDRQQEEDKETEDKSQENDEKEDNKSKVEILEEYRNNLIKLVDENSPIMKNVIGKLNDLVKNAKDDTWLNEYNSFVQNFNTNGSKIFEYLKEIYKDNKRAEKWLIEQEEILKRSNILVKMWHIISMSKYCIMQLQNQIDKQRTKDLTREQNAEIQNSAYMPISKNPELNEKVASKCTINIVVNKIGKFLSSADFNQLLPTDYENDIYNLGNSEKFNNMENELSKIIKIKYVEGNGIYGMVKQLITNKTIANALKTANIKKSIEQINYLHSAKDNKENPDRNLLLFYGVIRAVCTCLNNLDDNIKNMDIRAKENESIENIPGISDNILMNEIYKYIRGN